MLYYVTVTLYALVCLTLILVVLLQQGKGGDIAQAFGGGSSQAAFGARSGATVLSRATTVCAILFMLFAITLGILGQSGGGVWRRQQSVGIRRAQRRDGAVEGDRSARGALHGRRAAVDDRRSARQHGVDHERHAGAGSTSARPRTDYPGAARRDDARDDAVSPGDNASSTGDAARARTDGSEVSKKSEVRSLKFDRFVLARRGSGGTGRRTSLRGWR